MFCAGPSHFWSNDTLCWCRFLTEIAFRRSMPAPARAFAKPKAAPFSGGNINPFFHPQNSAAMRHPSNALPVPRFSGAGFVHHQPGMPVRGHLVPVARRLGTLPGARGKPPPPQMQMMARPKPNAMAGFAPKMAMRGNGPVSPFPLKGPMHQPAAPQLKNAVRVGAYSVGGMTRH